MEPLTVLIGRHGSQWYAENRELGIFVFASSIGRLLERVAEAFFFLWDEYVISDGKELAENERTIKQALRRMAGDAAKQKTV